MTYVRPHDWASVVAVGAAIIIGGGLLGGSPYWTVIGLVVATAAIVAARVWSRRNPGPMPYAFRWVLHLPRGSQSPRHLLRVLQPQPGERILEIGPGIGIHALPVAARLGPDGRLDALDAQPAMLADLEHRAGARGIRNIAPRAGDAQRLPYASDAFDAAYLIGVLGEIPEPEAALGELSRVVKPTGRLVVGEMILDPDYIAPSTLAAITARAGFGLERRHGAWMSYLARFVPGAARGQ